MFTETIHLLNFIYEGTSLRTLIYVSLAEIEVQNPKLYIFKKFTQCFAIFLKFSVQRRQRRGCAPPHADEGKPPHADEGVLPTQLRAEGAPTHNPGCFAIRHRRRCYPTQRCFPQKKVPIPTTKGASPGRACVIQTRLLSPTTGGAYPSRRHSTTPPNPPTDHRRAPIHREALQLAEKTHGLE